MTNSTWFSMTGFCFMSILKMAIFWRWTYSISPKFGASFLDVQTTFYTGLPAARAKGLNLTCDYETWRYEGMLPYHMSIILNMVDSFLHIKIRKSTLYTDIYLVAAAKNNPGDKDFYFLTFYIDGNQPCNCNCICRETKLSALKK